MGLYATPEQVTAELAQHAQDLDLPADLEPLIDAGQRAVDRRLGPLATDPATGLKLAPALLTVAQRAALARAVAAAVGHYSLGDAERTFGHDDYMPALLTLQRGSGLAPLIDAELAGFDLIQRSGCALPDPEPAIVLDDLPA